jgi:hypothetical protein
MRSILTCFLFAGSCLVKGQYVVIHSITTARGNSGDAGYTLDGSKMVTGARIKLLNPANFGPSGIYPKTVVIYDEYVTPGSLQEVFDLPYEDIFFFGSFNKYDQTLQPFGGSEIDSLYNWSLNGGKMIICAGQYYQQPPGWDSQVLDARWGISWVDSNPAYFNPVLTGFGDGIFKGPFGTINGVNQGGSLQGYLDPLNADSKVLAMNSNGKPTIIMDCKTLDLITADVDGFTLLGSVTSNSLVTNDQDKFWLNTIAFMDKLQPLPKVTYTNDGLALNSIYVAYQWYFNNQPIEGAVTATLPPDRIGIYQAEVTFNGGCKQKSPPFSVVGIHENNTLDGKVCIVPNPVIGHARIQFPDNMIDVHLSITDNLGRTVMSVVISGSSFDFEMDDVPAGVYQYSAIKSGLVLLNGKLVVE